MSQFGNLNFFYITILVDANIEVCFKPLKISLLIFLALWQNSTQIALINLILSIGIKRERDLALKNNIFTAINKKQWTIKKRI